MNLHFNSLTRLAAAAAVAAAFPTFAATGPNPYGKIPERNVFQLQPLTPPETKTPEPPPRRPPPKVSITGLVEIRGVPKALVEITATGRPVSRSILAAGGSADVLEILGIDVAAERVRVRLDGEEETLGIEKPKPPAQLPPTPPVPPLPGSRVPVMIRG